MKKGNLLLSLAITASVFAGVLNVGAVAPSKDTCKDGIVYTNYYYFSDAEVYNGDDYYDRDYVTQGNYGNHFQGGFSADDIAARLKGNTDDETLLVKNGLITVVGNSENASTIDKMKLSEFWTNVKTKEGSDNIDSSNHIAHFVTHTWNRLVDGQLQEVQTESRLINDLTVSQLSNASVKIKSPTVITFVEYANSNMIFQVKRLYSTGITPYMGSVTPVTIGEYDWYLQPAAYYIQYCTAKQEDSDTPTNGEYTVSYDANKGVDAPSSSKGNANTCVTIADAGKMNRSGYKFIGWSTNEKATTIENGFEVGAKYCGPQDKKLYAIWETGNPETGVDAHILAFGIAAIAAGAALVVARKKGLFKQI